MKIRYKLLLIQDDQIYSFEIILIIIFSGTSEKHWLKWVNNLILRGISGQPDSHLPSYLLRAHSDYISQLLYNEIDAFYAWFF